MHRGGLRSADPGGSGIAGANSPVSQPTAARVSYGTRQEKSHGILPFQLEPDALEPDVPLLLGSEA